LNSIHLNDLWIESNSTPEAAMDDPKKEVFLDASQGVVLMGRGVIGDRSDNWSFAVFSIAFSLYGNEVALARLK
jgi:hypothetical protein